MLTSELGKNIGIYTFHRITSKVTFSKREFKADSSHMTVLALLDKAWSRGWLYQLEGRLKWSHVRIYLEAKEEPST